MKMTKNFKQEKKKKIMFKTLRHLLSLLPMKF